MGLLGCESPAGKIYQRRVLATMLFYVGVVFTVAAIVHRQHPQGWWLYFVSLMPAVPVFVVFIFMGVYLRDERDEYLRMMNIWSLLVGTAVLMATIVASDFLRSFTPAGILPPFACFVIFFITYGIAQVVQKLRNRVQNDE